MWTPKRQLGWNCHKRRLISRGPHDNEKAFSPWADVQAPSLSAEYMEGMDPFGGQSLAELMEDGSVR